MKADDQIRLLEQNITAFNRRIPSAIDKDELRRRIKACRDSIREIKQANR